MSLVAWVLNAILSLHPEAPDRDRLAMAIANAAAEQVLFADDDGRKTAALLISVAWWETGRSFDCARVGDNGHSVSCWQVWACGPGFDAARCHELATNVFEAARAARDLLAQSLRECRRLEMPERISKYTTGRCVRNKESRIRWGTAQRLAKKFAHLEVTP